MAKALDYCVTGTCSTRNLEVAQRLGADHVIDYRVQSPLVAERRYDLVFDPVSNIGFSKAKHVVTPDGVYVSSIPTPGNMLVAPILNRCRRQQHRYLWVTPDGNALRRVAQMVEAGRIEPSIEKVYELHDIRKAHTHSESGRVAGKLALRIARPN